ncbi:M56 family metallopeptidase [Candidatus Latescibacterota bacterium]
MLWILSWQISMLTVIVWVISLFTRKTTPNFKYLLWCIIILRLCLPLNISVPIGVSNIFRTIAESKIQVALDKAEYGAQPVSLTELENDEPGGNEAFFAQAFSRQNIPNLLVTGWFVMVVFISFAMVIWLYRSGMALRGCPPVTNKEILSTVQKKCNELGIRQEVQVMYLDVDITDGPTVTGVFRPKIYIPRIIVDNWSIKDNEPIISHELVHIRQNDLLVNWLQIIFQILFFFHPLVWYANIKIRQLREEVCDDIAIQLTNLKRRRYSRGILSVLEEMFCDPNYGFVGLGFSERKHSLAKRILRIANKRYQYYKPMSAYAIIVLIIIYASSIAIASDSSIIKFQEQNIWQRNNDFIPHTEEYINVRIIDSKEYLVDGIKTNNTEFQTALKKVMDEKNNYNIAVSADSNVSHQEINEIIEEAFNTGAEFVYLNQ